MHCKKESCRLSTMSLQFEQSIQVYSETYLTLITWIRSTSTIPGQIWRQYEGPQIFFTELTNKRVNLHLIVIFQKI